MTVDAASWHTPYPADPAEPPPRDKPLASRRRAGPLFARLALAFGVLILLVVASHPLWLAPLLSRHLTAAAGRTVHFDSVAIGLSGSLAPVVHLRGVRVDNAPWTGSAAPFAALADAVFVFAWQRFEERRVVTYLLLRQGEVHLERSADGLRNWRLSDPQDRGPGHYWFEALEAHDVRLGFIHQGIDLDVTAAEHDMPVSTSKTGDALTARIAVDGTFRKLAFNGSVDAGPVLSFLKSESWFGLRGQAAIDGARLDVDGRAANLFRGLRVDAEAELAGRSLAGLRPFVGDRYAEARAFRARGHVAIAAERYALEQAEVHVGASDLAGDAAWWRDGERHAVRAHVTSDSTDLADLLWLAGRSVRGLDKAADAAGGTSPAQGGRDLFSGLRSLDADIAFDARRFHAAELRALRSMRLRAELGASRQGSAALDLGWTEGGRTGARLGLDLRQPLARVAASFDADGLRLPSLLPARADGKSITGTMRGRAELKASGNTTAALRASASGSGSLQLRDGTIPSLLDAEMGLEGGKVLRTLLSGSDALALPCAAIRFEVADGRAHLSEIVIDSANTRVGGSGNIDLRDETIDLVLTPTPKRPGLDLKRSIRVFGHLPRPQHELIEQVAPPGSSGLCTLPAR